LPAIFAVSLLAGTPAKPAGGVVLITIDTLRADHLGCYGYRNGATPTIDALAVRAAKFEHAYAVAPLTLPSHAALLTGTFPFTHGVRDQPGFRLPKDIPTLAEAFSHSGYATAAVLGSPVLSRRFGLDHGFDDYDDRFGATTAEQEAGLPDIKRPADSVVHLALAWLDHRSPDKPFFLWLHFYDPHLPYRLPEPFLNHFAKHPYDGEIAYTDSALAMFFDGLRRRGLFDSSIIALTADHGEGLGDHGESTHGYFIYDSTIHVPLLVKPAHAAHGEKFNAPVSLVDLAPTLLHLAGIQSAQSMQGTDLTQSILSGIEPPQHPVYAETMYPLLHLGWNPLRAYIVETTYSHAARGALKLIQAPRPELYDLASDPREEHNEVSSQPAKAAVVRDQLESFVQANSPAKSPSARVPVSQQTRELLAGLGYLAQAGAPVPEFTTSRRDPKDRVSEHELLLGAAHDFQARRYEAATRTLNEVLAKDPSQPLALDYLGTIQLLSHDVREAHATFARLVKAAPYYPPAYLELGHTETILGNRVEAEQFYRRAMEVDPSNPRPPRELGMLLVEDGKMEPAEALLGHALDLDPSDVFALNALGEILAREKRYQDAAGLLERALNADARQVTVSLNLGFVYLQLKRFHDVEALMKKTLELDPRQPQAYAEVGVARLESGDKPGAQDAFRRALALDPHNPMALQGAQAAGLTPIQ